MSYNPHTMAGIIAIQLVHNSVIAELVALLTAEQRLLLADRLKQHTADIGPVDEFDPECAELQQARYQEWIDTLAPKP